MTDFENAHKLFTLLGDYWFQLFGETGQARTYVEALTEMYKQVSQRRDELERSLSRHEIDVFRLYRNLPVKLYYSDFINYSTTAATYDGEYSFNKVLNYDSVFIDTPRFKLPTKCVSFDSIVDSYTDPSVVAENCPVANGYVTLPFNPFKRFPVHSDPNDYVILWLKNARLDYNDIYEQYGYTLGIKLESSQRYKDIINAIMDCLVNGGSEDNVLKFVKAVTGATGSVVTWKDIPALAIDTNLCLTGSLVFKSEALPPKVTSENGITRFELPVFGAPEDVKKFQDYCFNEGLQGYVKITDEARLMQIREELNVLNL